MYICAHCGSIMPFDPQTLDTGTTFTCAECGKDTIVLLLRPDDYRVNTDLLAALRAEGNAQ